MLIRLTEAPQYTLFSRISIITSVSSSMSVLNSFGLSRASHSPSVSLTNTSSLNLSIAACTNSLYTIAAS